MLTVKLVVQFQRIPEILSRFPPSHCLTVTCPLYEMKKLPVVSLTVDHLIHIIFVTVVHDLLLRFSWWLTGSKRCVTVEQSNMETVVHSDCTHCGGKWLPRLH